MEMRWVVIGAVVVCVILFVIFLIPFFLNADAFRPTIEGQLSGALGRDVTLGKLSFSLLQGNLTADDITISDDPEFSKVPFIQAKKLNVGLEMLPLLMHKQVRITRLAMDTPSIQLIEHANGRWNYSSLGTGSVTHLQAGSTTDLSLGELKITNGSALLSELSAATKPFEYSDVNLTLKQFSFSTSFSFDLSAKLPGGGTVKVTGNAGPILRNDVSRTPFQAKLELRDFDLVGAGVIDPSKGISADNDVDAQITLDETTASSTGKITASRLQLSQRGTPSQQPVEMDFTISENMKTRQGAVSDLAIHTGSAVIHVNGSFENASQGVGLKLRLSVPGLPIDELGRLLPTVGIRLPSGSSLKSGTMTANISITGPATAAVLTGPVEIDNTKLAGFVLGSNIEGLTPLKGASAGTDIRTLRANVNSSPEVTRFTDIYGEFPELGSATGSGTVAPSGELAFQLIGKISTQRGSGATPNAGLSAARVVPLTISGSAADPTIRANPGALR